MMLNDGAISIIKRHADVSITGTVLRQNVKIKMEHGAKAT